MKNFILFLAIVCGGVTVMFYTAAKEAVDGPNWASKLCRPVDHFHSVKTHGSWPSSRLAWGHSGS